MLTAFSQLALSWPSERETETFFELTEGERNYRVHVIDEATVVERGERVRVWFLPLNDGWVRAKDHPGSDIEEAQSEDRNQRCPPGTIWKREVELILPAGTPLLSRITSPLIERMDPMEYLTRGKRGVRRHVEETWFVVIGNYRLKKSKEPLAFSHARKAHHAAAESRSKRPNTRRS